MSRGFVCFTIEGNSLSRGNVLQILGIYFTSAFGTQPTDKVWNAAGAAVCPSCLVIKTELYNIHHWNKDRNKQPFWIHGSTF